MGTSASILTSEQSSLEHRSNSTTRNISNTWMDFSVTTHSHYKYHRVHVNVSMPIVESFLSRQISLIDIQGYHWINSEITKAEDDEKNTACLCELDEHRKKKLITLCQDGGLFSHYVENYSIPEIIPPEKLFIAINFFIKSPENKNITIRLSGCIPRSEINITDLQPPHEGPSGSWFTHFQTIFPSNKLFFIRKTLHHWWREVEQLCHMSASQVEADAAKNRFFVYSKSQSTAYRQALEAGLQTVVGQQHLQEYEEYKIKCKQAAYCLSSAVLDTLFTEGEMLLLKLIHPSSTHQPHTQQPQQPQVYTDRTNDETRVYLEGVKDSLKRCKNELHAIFEKSLYRLASALESHEKHAWAAFYNRYTLGKMDDQQTAATAEKLLRSTRAKGRPTSTPGGGRKNRKNGGNAGKGEERRKSSGLSTDFSLFSLPTKPSRRSLSLSPNRQKFSRPKTSPGISALAHNNSRHNEHHNVRFATSTTPTNTTTTTTTAAFDVVTTSLHPEKRKFSRRSVSPSALSSPPSSSHPQPQTEPPSPSHRASISIIQTSQNLILNSVRNRLQCRLELYRKDKIYNYFGTYIHQVIFQFQILMFETAVRYEMDQYLEGEYERMMGSVERTARKEFVALTAVQSKEKVQLLNQGIIPDREKDKDRDRDRERSQWTGRSSESPDSRQATERGFSSGRSEDKGSDLEISPLAAAAGDRLVIGFGEKSVKLTDDSLPEPEKDSSGGLFEDSHSEEKHDKGASKLGDKPRPLSIITEDQTNSSPTNEVLLPSPSQLHTSLLSTTSVDSHPFHSPALHSLSSPSLTPSSNTSLSKYQQQHEARYTELQHQHMAELNELEFKFAEKRRSKLNQFNKMKYQTYQIMTNKLQTIRNSGSTAELSPTGVALFNNICHVYQFLRSSEKYVAPEGNILTTPMISTIPAGGGGGGGGGRRGGRGG